MAVVDKIIINPNVLQNVKGDVYVRNITNNGDLTNWTQASNYETLSIGNSEYRVEIRCHDGYVFDRLPVLTEFKSPENVLTNFEVNNDNTIAFIEFDNRISDYGVGSEWRTKTIPIERPVKLSSDNVTLEFQGDSIITIDEPSTIQMLEGDYNITATPNDGYVVNSGVLEIESSPEVPREVNFNVDDNQNIATLFYSLQNNDEWDFRFNLTYVGESEPDPDPEPDPEPDPPIISGGILNNLYHISNSNMFEMYYQLIGNPDEQPEVTNYIINLLRLPFKIPNRYIGDIEKVKVGKTQFNDVEVNKIKSDIININLGKISVPTKYNNLKDYVNTNIFLHLPFSNTIELPIEYVIGYEIDIEYVIDLYEGNGTVNVISNKTDRIFYSEKISIGYNVPMINRQLDSVINNLSNFKVYNNLRTAYIEVIRNIPYEDDFTLIESKETIVDLTGYFETVNINLDLSIRNSREKDMLQTILNQGVYINGEN